jgi:hypothetical protein
MIDTPKVPIYDFENEIPRSFPSEERSLDRGDFPPISSWGMPHARSILHTFFSTTQLELLKTRFNSGITFLEMFPEKPGNVYQIK